MKQRRSVGLPHPDGAVNAEMRFSGMRLVIEPGACAVSVNNRQIAALNLAKSAGEDHTYTIKKRKGFKYELKFIFYGMAIALLLVTLIGLIATILLQI